MNNKLNIDRIFSANIVHSLRKDMTLKKIGELIGQSESYISLVNKAKRSFTLKHLLTLESALGKPLPLIMLQSLMEAKKEDAVNLSESAQNNLQEHYNDLCEIFNKSYNIWQE